MLALFAAGLARPSRPLTLSVVFIALGTALASAGEVNLDPFGVSVHMVSMVAEAVRLVMTQLLLAQQGFHPSERGEARPGAARRMHGGVVSHSCRGLPSGSLSTPSTHCAALCAPATAAPACS